VIVSSHLPISRISNEFIIQIDKDLAELHIESKDKKA